MRESCGSRFSFVGSAMVVGSSYGEHSTTLTLRNFAGESFGFTVHALPDDAAAALFYENNLRPISVKIQHGGARCTAIALSADGPQSMSIPLGIALALLQRKVHAVVEGGMHSDVPCSSNMSEHEVPC